MTITLCSLASPSWLIVCVVLRLVHWKLLLGLLAPSTLPRRLH